ncbi:hypothetical protein ACV07N_06310 [Roseivirga echinicomitans]
MKNNTPYISVPGNVTQGYDKNDFDKYVNKHLMSYPKRNEKLYITHGKRIYFPVSIMFFLEGYDQPEFISPVTEYPIGSKNPAYISNKSSMTPEGNNKWIVEMKAKYTGNPKDEYMVQFDILLDKDEWGDCELLGVVVNGLFPTEEEKKRHDLLTVECDIIIPPPPPTF